jgi:hypothetical protein
LQHITKIHGTISAHMRNFNSANDHCRHHSFSFTFFSYRE